MSTPRGFLTSLATAIAPAERTTSAAVTALVDEHAAADGLDIADADPGSDVGPERRESSRADRSDPARSDRGDETTPGPQEPRPETPPASRSEPVRAQRQDPAADPVPPPAVDDGGTPPTGTPDTALPPGVWSDDRPHADDGTPPPAPAPTTADEARSIPATADVDAPAVDDSATTPAETIDVAGALAALEAADPAPEARSVEPSDDTGRPERFAEPPARSAPAAAPDAVTEPAVLHIGTIEVVVEAPAPTPRAGAVPTPPSAASTLARLHVSRL